ncbi:ribonuclease Z [Pyrococcus abyssi]|uniref:Ribonuclease Z n=1 Tax=Pyrococcus abyssi (strain GE5 / Orsay) TaxID=272844 RepID=RNZ_PYRAB|nr:ribonuclease Z [Pyrococcus abyssi]Q9UZP4.1 RecName: Full=Ribonuclease Z; Short=RNase Z; AltName: Full=tRNA 3 endonuclease; AltName: Full=tRNase Z [Pyrococcus abyssi GE5]CAB50012.1 Putative sulfatase, ATSA/ELAC family [Pyrococcus abyssi GE5]CCE70514.1 TPA: ribonuclease Z [Pyrococcus abyssi GE5]
MIEVIFLGTGGIKPTPERNVPSIAIKVEGELILFDVGEGTLRQMEIAGLSPMKIRRIFITHFHGDHYLGLPALIQTMNLWKRKEPLHIYGPENSIEFIKNLLNSGYFAPSFDVTVHELPGKARLQFEKYEVWAFEVSHGVPALGYVFKEKDRRGSFDLEKIKNLGLEPGPWMKELEEKKVINIGGRTIRLSEVTGPKKRGAKIVYTGDTEPCENVIQFSRRANLLIHEATYLNSEDRGESYHTTVEEACEIWKKSKAFNLALFHRGPRYSFKEYKEGATKLCPQAMIPRDFDRIMVKGAEYVIFKVR